MQKFNYMKVKKFGSDWLIHINIYLDSNVVLDVERPKMIISFVRIKSVYIWLEWSKTEKIAVNYL